MCFSNTKIPLLKLHGSITQDGTGGHVSPFYICGCEPILNVYFLSPLGDACPVGHYCPSGVGQPIPCDPGTYADTELNAVCAPCSEGHYCINGSIPEVCMCEGFYEGQIIDIEYNKRLDRQRPCLEGDFNGGSNNIVQSNKSV